MQNISCVKSTRMSWCVGCPGLGSPGSQLYTSFCNRLNCPSLSQITWLINSTACSMSTSALHPLFARSLGPLSDSVCSGCDLCYFLVGSVVTVFLSCQYSWTTTAYSLLFALTPFLQYNLLRRKPRWSGSVFGSTTLCNAISSYMLNKITYRYEKLKKSDDDVMLDFRALL